MQTNPDQPSAAQTTQPAKILLISGLIVLLLGLAMTWFGVVFVGEANESRDWPVAEGKVQNVRVTWDTTSSSGEAIPDREYFYEIKYEYVVDDQVYAGDRYSLGDGSNAAGRRYNTEEEAREAAYAVYNAAQAVPVYYDPVDPGSAVLAPGANSGTYVPLIFGVVLLLSGAGLLWLYMRQRAAAGV